jgi:hypothetical protein
MLRVILLTRETLLDLRSQKKILPPEEIDV